MSEIPSPEIPSTGNPLTRTRFSEQTSGRFTMALILAICLAFASVTAYVFYNQKPPVAAGTITRLSEYPIHMALRQSGSREQGLGGGVESEDEVLVLAEVDLRNTWTGPLFLYQEQATLTSPEGEQKQVLASSASETGQAFRFFPQLGRQALPVIPREATLKPGQTLHGLMLFAFPIARAEWEARRGFDVTLGFRWQRPLVLDQPKPAL